MKINKDLQSYKTKLIGAFKGYEKSLDMLERVTITGELHDGTKMEVSLIEVLAKMFYAQFWTITPYKKEDLRTGIWLWDDVEKKCFQITDFYKGDMVCQSESYPEFCVVISFEENRFYPIFTFNDLLQIDIMEEIKDEKTRN